MGPRAHRLPEDSAGSPAESSPHPRGEGEEYVVDPEYLASVAGIESERAEQLADLATRVVAAHLYPTEIPSPVPTPIGMVGLRLALRLNSARPDAAGSVVSESIGSYTYRLQSAKTLDAALELPSELVKELAPWAPKGRQGVYDIDVTGLNLVWPIDWFQRDLDTLDEVIA